MNNLNNKIIKLYNKFKNPPNKKILKIQLINPLKICNNKISHLNSKHLFKRKKFQIFWKLKKSLQKEISRKKIYHKLIIKKL
jgi:hypothetical protein